MNEKENVNSMCEYCELKYICMCRGKEGYCGNFNRESLEDRWSFYYDMRIGGTKNVHERE